MTEKKDRPRGFAAMSPEMRREVASRGGKSVPPERRAYSINRQLAKDAGRVGGRATKVKSIEIDIPQA